VLIRTFKLEFTLKVAFSCIKLCEPLPKLKQPINSIKLNRGGQVFNDVVVTTLLYLLNVAIPSSIALNRATIESQLLTNKVIVLVGSIRRRSIYDVEHEVSWCSVTLEVT